MPHLPPEWLSTDAAAAYIGVRAPTLRRLVNRGEVIAFQIGRVRRYRRADLDAFLDQAQVRPTNRQQPPQAGRIPAPAPPDQPIAAP